MGRAGTTLEESLSRAPLTQLQINSTRERISTKMQEPPIITLSTIRPHLNWLEIPRRVLLKIFQSYPELCLVQTNRHLIGAGGIYCSSALAALLSELLSILLLRQTVHGLSKEARWSHHHHRHHRSISPMGHWIPFVVQLILKGSFDPEFEFSTSQKSQWRLFCPLPLFGTTGLCHI